MMTNSITQKDHYQEDEDISANNICRRSSSSGGDMIYIGYNSSGECSRSPLITLYYSSLYPIIATSVEYIQ